MTIKEKLRFEYQYYAQMLMYADRDNKPRNAEIYNAKAEECAYLYNWLEEQEK